MEDPRCERHGYRSLVRRFEIAIVSTVGGRMPVRATIEDPVVIQRILRHLGLSVEAGEALPTTRGSYSRTAARFSLPATLVKGKSRPTAKRPGPAITTGSNAAIASR